MPKTTLLKLTEQIEHDGIMLQPPIDAAKCRCGELHIFAGDAHRDSFKCINCGLIVLVYPPDNSIPRTSKNMAWIKDKLQAFSSVYGFPKNEQGMTMLCEQFLKIVHDEERAEWLLEQLADMEMRRFPMPIVMRRIYDTRWTPADGRKPNETIASQIENEL
jgi:hypothetical protein